MRSVARMRRSALGAPDWTPAALGSAILLWLRADAGTYQSAGGSAAAADGDPVGQWQDQSANANHGAQTTGTKKPTLKLAIQNGKPAARFDGGDVLALTSGIAFGSGKSFFMAGRPNDTAAYKTAFGGDAVTGSNSWELRFNPSESAEQLKSNVALFGTSTAGYSTAAWSLVGATYDGTSYTFRKNGAANGSGTSSQTIPNNIEVVGGNTNGPTTGFSGDIGELIICNGVLSAANVALLETYLNARWALY